mmetsp:Transcript_23607/g.55784  ORF Transcript_23607/g.55784 Transcript_23607/m.55784 type:complete len:620 (-) Transcript_23607:104-1963(-)
MISLSPQLASKGRVDGGLHPSTVSSTMSSRTSGYSEGMALQYLTGAPADSNLSALASRSSNRTFADSVHPPVVHNPPQPETGPSVPLYPPLPPLPPLRQTANNRRQQYTELGDLISEDRFPRPVDGTSPGIPRPQWLQGLTSAPGSGRPPTDLEQQGTCLVAPRARRALPPVRMGDGPLDGAAKAPPPSVEHPLLLYTAEDERHLTDLHCFVRKRCVFLFAASQQDVDVPRKGRKKALTLGQVGIGCLHCKDSESKLKGSTYFPTSITGIYNATMIINQRHFPVCPHVDKETFATYNQLKGLTARSASTKEYWIEAAAKLGLVDTPRGVFYRPSSQRPASSHKDGDPRKIAPSMPLRTLVETSDKLYATNYAYFVIEQMTTCTFSEADKLGKRKHHVVGFPGMACRHCYGGNGSGRFFPLTLKTFSDVSKSINVLRNHLVKCPKAPAGLAEHVTRLFEEHQAEKSKSPFGSQKVFFDLVWKRLHPELSPKPENYAVKKKVSKSRRKSHKSEPVKSLERAVIKRKHATLDAGPATFPSVPLVSDAKGRCRIPKKRYMHEARERSASESSRAGLQCIPPPHHQEHLQELPYSESDMSVAMILAGLEGSSSHDSSTQDSVDV